MATTDQHTPHPDEIEDDEDAHIEGSAAPLIEHLAELRTRLIRSVIAFLIAMIACFTVAEPILNFLAQPIAEVLRARGESPQLIFTAPQEKFFVLIRISVIGGFAFSFPVIAHQLWRFVAPASTSPRRTPSCPSSSPRPRSSCWAPPSRISWSRRLP